MKYIIILFTCSVIGFAACNNSTTPGGTTSDSTNTTSTAPKAPPQSNLGDAGTTQLMDVVNKYFSLKNALVATKAAIADSAAAQLATQAGAMLTALEKDSVNRPQLTPYLDTIINQSKIIAAISDESCEKQRLAFGAVSSAIYGLAKKVDLKNAKIYHQYCPMAFNDKGAFWLSDENEIKNPYFGKKMMECGETVDSL